MMKFNHSYIFFISLVISMPGHGQAQLDPACRPVSDNQDKVEELGKYGQGLLWRVSKPGVEPSHIFGTIHVYDEKIQALPEPVAAALKSSSAFVMEALPDPEQAISFAGTMFFDDGQRLDTMLPAAIFERAVTILDGYNVPAAAVAMMKPWAAFLTISYPAAKGVVLDLQLLQMAQASGMEVSGLETFAEQANLFIDISEQDQLTLLKDTICYYPLIQDNFMEMKNLYLQRDLQALLQHAERYIFPDMSAYEQLLQKLFVDRNKRMVKRMRPILQRGNAFIAVGAMHLPGAEGILPLLEQQGYDISRVY